MPALLGNSHTSVDCAYKMFIHMYVNAKCYTVNVHAREARQYDDEEKPEEIYSFRYVKGREKEGYPTSGDSCKET
jgi:hypothetical protein